RETGRGLALRERAVPGAVEAPAVGKPRRGAPRRGQRVRLRRGERPPASGRGECGGRGGSPGAAIRGRGGAHVALANRNCGDGRALRSVDRLAEVSGACSWQRSSAASTESERLGAGEPAVPARVRDRGSEYPNRSVSHSPERAGRNAAAAVAHAP